MVKYYNVARRMAVSFLSCLGLGRPSVLLAVLQEWRCAVTLGRQVGNPVS